VSVIAVGGRRYAAGLYWLSRGGARQTARTARRLGRPWCVHDGERTGFAADGGGSADGLHPAGSGPEGLQPAGVHLEGIHLAGVPALALALKAHIESGFWMALVGGDGGGGEGRYALVKARGGAVLADGDEVFDDRAAALAAFERARELGWALYATPGLAAELSGPGPEVAALDVAALDAAAAAEGGAIELTAAAPARARRRLLPAALGLAVLAAGGAWLEHEALMDWLAPPPPVPEVWGPEPTVPVAVDGAALIAACRRALMENPPFLPAWRIQAIACAARFADPALTSLRPELAGRPVLLVRWHLAAGHRGTPWSGEALQRRLAEAHLARWHAASVADGRAWAAMPLGPVLRIADLQTPSFLELRRAVDRTFGASGAGVGYARGADTRAGDTRAGDTRAGDGAWAVRIDDSGPLERLARLADGIAGLEITALSRGEADTWRLEGRLMAPETVPVSGLAALGVVHEATPAAAGPTQPQEEDDDGTQGHDGA